MDYSMQRVLFFCIIGTNSQNDMSVQERRTGMKLEGKVAIVTGGGTGIGAATTKKFVAEGAKVLISGRRKEKLEETAASLPAGTVKICRGDVSKHEDIKKMVAAALEFNGKIDVLVNNAAAAELGGSVTELPVDRWEYILKVNLTACFLLMRECIPLMIKNGGGSIVNIASLAGKRCLPHSPGYCTTKAALIHLTKQVAMDYSRDGIRCNAVCPAAVITDMTKGMVGPISEKMGTDMKGAYDFFTRNIPSQRACDPMEIANLCAFLASDESSFITGEDILADGGACVVDVMSISLDR